MKYGPTFPSTGPAISFFSIYLQFSPYHHLYITLPLHKNGALKTLMLYPVSPFGFFKAYQLAVEAEVEIVVRKAQYLLLLHRFFSSSLSFRPFVQVPYSLSLSLYGLYSSLYALYHFRKLESLCSRAFIRFPFLDSFLGWFFFSFVLDQSLVLKVLGDLVISSYCMNFDFLTLDLVKIVYFLLI